MLVVTIQTPELVGRAAGVETWRVRWSSTLTTPAYRVYQNGEAVFDGTTSVEVMDFVVPAGGDLFIEVRDDATAPEEVYSGVVVLGWNASAGATSYRVKLGGVVMAVIPADGRGWYEWTSPVIDDETTANFEVEALSAAGVVSLEMQVLVPMGRSPDAPAQAESYSSGTGLITAAA